MNIRKYLTGFGITELFTAVIFLSCLSAPAPTTTPDELDLSIREEVRVSLYGIENVIIICNYLMPVKVK